MKGAYLLAKTEDFFEQLKRYLRDLGYRYELADNSIRLQLSGDLFLWLYDHFADSTADIDDTPEAALKEGYCYDYLVECRDEEAFCRIVGGAPSTLDFLICDGNGTLYKPDQLSPHSIVL